MKIFSTPCQSGPHAPAHADQMLRHLLEVSRPRLHEMVSDPDEADFIFVSNLPIDVDQQELRRHWLFPKYLKKTFALWDAWNTPFLLPGIYVNAVRGCGSGRFRTGSYALHHVDFKNPYVESFDAKGPGEREPDLLCSFLGRNCHPCRDRIFRTQFERQDILIEDTSRFDAFSHDSKGKAADQRRYAEICLRSKFILCPRGVGASSIRLFEALKLGVAPVIISDEWKPCVGPEWKRGAIFVREADVGRLEEVLITYEPRWREMGAAARQIHDTYFSERAYFNFLVTNVAAIARRRVVPERLLSWLWPLKISMYKKRTRLAAVPLRQRAAAILGAKLFTLALMCDRANELASMCAVGGTIG